MKNLRRTTGAIAAGALIATPLTVLTATPASAGPEKSKEFRVAGAEVDFEVEKDDGRFEVSIDIDDAKPRSKWRIVLHHDGKRVFKQTRRADSDGEIEIDRKRKNTKGKDVFKLKVKKVKGPKKVRKIRMR